MAKSSLNKLLQISSLSKSFGGIKAVDDCSFEIESKTITGLIGPNGSGKSTIFNLIGGNIKPDSGGIYFNGEKIHALDVATRAKLGVSRLYQKARLFNNLTVEDNIKLALEESDFRFVPRSKTYYKNRLDHQIIKMLDIKKLLDKKAADLSFGQKRLVEIARCFLLPHKIMLMDEPIAGVAPHLRDEISNFLKEMHKQGETILIIEHDMNFIKNLVDTVIVMDAGKVIAKGHPDSVLKQKEVIEAYLG